MFSDYSIELQTFLSPRFSEISIASKLNPQFNFNDDDDDDDDDEYDDDEIYEIEKLKEKQKQSKKKLIKINQVDDNPDDSYQ